jgi:hypothetical protein
MSVGSEVHIWNVCHHCGQAPIKGPRHHCETCRIGPEGDLCAACYAGFARGRVPHPAGDDPFRTARHNFVVVAGAPADRHLGWLEPPVPSAIPPKVAAGSLVRPEFFHRSASSFGAYASIVQAGPRILALTALHVLDEVARKNGVDTTVENTAYTGEELPRVVTRVNLYDALEEKWAFHCLGTAGSMLVLANARSNVEEPSGHRDIAAFVVSNDSNVRPMRLAAASPEIGEPVWLAARFERGARLNAGVVVDKTDLSFVFRLAERLRGPKYTSGAPILNVDGEVVAINVGAGWLEGQPLGHAIHAESIHTHLRAATPGIGAARVARRATG